MHDPTRNDDGCSAWNPGIAPGVPRALRPLETLFRPENSDTSADEAADLAALSGLAEEDLVVFRAPRLALHEVIVRVTAELAVEEGELEEQFGRNFRAIAQRLFEVAVVPAQAAIESAVAAARAEAAAAVAAALEGALPAPAPAAAAPAGLWHRLRGLGGRRQPDAHVRPASPRGADDAHRLVESFRVRAGAADAAPLQRIVDIALHRTLGAFLLHHGRLPADRALLARIAGAVAGGRWAAQRVAGIVGPRFDAAVAQEGFARAPIRDKPVLISLKGASAAGKSSLRPMVKAQLEAQGIPPDGYATISPDVWRRLLLDYESLGPHAKYAGPLTSRELAIIDGKLDRHIRRRARHDGGIPHLVVDRFRFDSFESEKVARVLHDTYARHVDTLVMYFVVTPPEETVERGWRRALERGRYKAVEDFLGHSVEAYAGMPKLLFKWLAHARPEYRFHFLDNRVPKGDFPKTIAFGTQGSMTVLDPSSLLDIERYTKIDVLATRPEAVYPPEARFDPADPGRHAGFLRECLRRIARVSFVDPETGRLWAESVDGALRVTDPAALDDPARRGLLAALG